MHRRLNLLVRPLKSVPLPVRVILAALLLVGGMLGALPILGFWMIPLALLILSLDFRWARRGYLGIILWFRRRRRQRQSTETTRDGDCRGGDGLSGDDRGDQGL
ncbi:MAG: hypothetical protein OXU71_13085 [Gammaproteobacteria bacterium]|nr:hypothetical protein [Gammaproteobacteria bacterium]